MISILILFLLGLAGAFFLGRWSVPTRKPENDTIDAIVDRARSMVTPSRAVIPPGIIPFKTEEERENERNGDKALADEWEKNGIAELIRSKNDK